MPEIDNIHSHKDIRNLMFCCTKRDDGTSNGVIQLYNQKHPIQKKDKKKLDAISRFFGQNIQKIEEITKKLTTKLSVKFEADDITKDIEFSQKTKIEVEDAWSNCLKPLNDSDN